MSIWDKINAAVAYLTSRGVKKQLASPFLYRLLWWVGVPFAPPLFQRLIPFALIWGTYGTVWFSLGAIISALIATRPTESILERWVSWMQIMIPSSYAFAGFVGAYLRWYAAALGLSSWDEFDPNPDASDSEW